MRVACIHGELHWSEKEMRGTDIPVLTGCCRGRCFCGSESLRAAHLAMGSDLGQRKVACLHGLQSHDVEGWREGRGSLAILAVLGRATALALFAGWHREERTYRLGCRATGAPQCGAGA